MWIGSYIVLDDAIKRFLTKEKLIGLSVTEDLADFRDNNEDLASKSYYDQVKFIDEHHRTWNRISVSEKAQKMFDFANKITMKNRYL